MGFRVPSNTLTVTRPVVGSTAGLIAIGSVARCGFAIWVRVYRNPNPRSPGRRGPYQARPEAVVLGSAAALTVPFFQSITIPALSFNDHGLRIVTLCPRFSSSAFTVSGIRLSSCKSPGYMVCGNGEDGKLRVDHL